MQAQPPPGHRNKALQPPIAAPPHEDFFLTFLALALTSASFLAASSLPASRSSTMPSVESCSTHLPHQASLVSTLWRSLSPLSPPVHPLLNSSGRLGPSGAVPTQAPLPEEPPASTVPLGQCPLRILGPLPGPPICNLVLHRLPFDTGSSLPFPRRAASASASSSRRRFRHRPSPSPAGLPPIIRHGLSGVFLRSASLHGPSVPTSA